MIPTYSAVPARLLACVATVLWLAPLGELVAQTNGSGDAVPQIELFAGDSVRINGDFVGRVLSIQGPSMTVVSRGTQRCRAGEMHGDAPICDPAPMIRREMDLSAVAIERRMKKGNMALRTIAGGILGFGAFGAAGYFIGPEFGFGKVDGCVEVSETALCTNPVSREEVERRQKSTDQKKGVMFFGLIGGTATAIVARKLSVGWVRIQPAIPVLPEEPWGLSLAIPTGR